MWPEEAMPKKATPQGAMPEEAMPVGGDDAQEGDALRVGRSLRPYSIASAGRLPRRPSSWGRVRRDCPLATFKLVLMGKRRTASSEIDIRLWEYFSLLCCFVFTELEKGPESPVQVVGS